tara:strand:+ start:1325 stop:1813 length:489 start_codon:yes stop_codon:yes gene_type:complete
VNSFILAYVGIGSNLGDSIKTVNSSLNEINLIPGTKLVTLSSLYLSSPIDAKGNDFVNAVAVLETKLSASKLLLNLQKIEQNFGRKRTFKNAPRVLDLDLLLYGEKKINTSFLQVPHPRMVNRAFVLVPLTEINPSVEIPGKGKASDFILNVTNQPIKKLIT